jgi:MSHA biogenesis protein MshJ
MKEKWGQLKNRFEAFAMRERLLLVGAALALVYLLWEMLLFHPMAKEKQILVARERVAQQAIQMSEAEITVLKNIVSKDPNVALRQEIADLRARLNSLDQQLDTLAVGLVPAHTLPKVMHSILSKTGKLHIEQLITLPPETLNLSADVKKAEIPTAAVNSSPMPQPNAAPVEQGASVYRHSVVLNLSGDFAGIVQYLRELESSDWRFYWESLRYQVTEYPQAKIRLRVFTLSSQRGVLDGV